MWQEKLEPPDMCVERARQRWTAFVNTNAGTPDRTPMTCAIIKCIAPPPGCFKLNIDGAWSASKLVGGFGAVIRSDSGDFVAAMCGSFEGVYSPLQAEALAFRESLHWAVNRGFPNLVFESDSLQIVEAVKNPTLNLSPIGQVVEDIKELLHAIIEATVTHTRRNANFAAHRLARTGLSLNQRCEWHDSPPSFLFDILVKDGAGH